MTLANSTKELILEMFPKVNSLMNTAPDDGLYYQQFLIETHSEHFIRKLQVLIADKDCEITADDVAVYYIDKNEKGEAIIDKLIILPNGQFEKDWPSGFFDKAFELSLELIKKNS